jgi:type IV secretory pathway VirB10-like protein
MSEQTEGPGTAPVTDRRTAPRGVLPRGVQTWLMAGLAVGIVLIILLTGQPEPSPRPAPSTATQLAPSPDRVRDYQDRLRALEARAAYEAQAAGPEAPPPRPEPVSEPQARGPEDPLVAERRRREYESLFASNVVLSRRPESSRPDAGRSALAGAGPSFSRDTASPSIDEIAEAVVRASVRAGGTAPGTLNPATQPPPAAGPGSSEGGRSERTMPASTPPIAAAGPLHRLLEGTLIDAVLTNRLDGSAAAPVNCLVTNPVYSHSGQHVVIPAGARVLGETKPVQTFGESRLAVAFHRLLMPDGRTYGLDQFLGLNQIGDTGLRDRVNHHYLSTFGAAGAVGLISGLSQLLGTAGFAGGNGDRTVVIAGGAAEATTQASMQVMNRFLNRLPTITIREGHRVKVYLTSDIELPAYEVPAIPGTR